MTDIQIVEIFSDEDMEAAFHIRRVVFCDEQKVDAQEEFDGLDGDCRQYLARRGGHIVGTARLRKDSAEKTKIERVAVLQEERGHGVGQETYVSYYQRCKIRWCRDYRYPRAVSCPDFL